MSELAMRADAAQRVRERLRDWFKTRGRGSKKALAAAIPAKYGEGKSLSWVTGIQKPKSEGGQDIRLQDLDSIAELMDVPAGELVAEHGHIYRELTMTEARLLDYYRGLPETVRRHWIEWLDYLFRFQQTALKEQGRERAERTAKARRKEAARTRLHRFDGESA